MWKRTAGSDIGAHLQSKGGARMPAVRPSLALLVLLGAPLPARADPQLADFEYPYAVHHYDFQSQGQSLEMAFMDVEPRVPNGRTIVLLHGKNFCAATWEASIVPLSEAGYRVVVPDQIGFCKSSKPQAYQFGLHQLAANTHALLASLGVERPVVVGHSMGGMLALRYALMYPHDMAGLVVVNPIGLEDWKAKGVPLVTVDQLYARERKTSFDSIKRYQQTTYYAGVWKPAYDRWVQMLASMYAGDGGTRVAWNQALTSDMILSQPVVHEFDRIAVPTTLMIGQKDTTAIGKDRAPPELASTLGNYPELGQLAHQRIKGSVLLSFPELGHSPQVQDPPQFNKALLEQLQRFR
jgi:pimeloyl-ACP methyl ester carboxylesterase